MAVALLHPICHRGPEAQAHSGGGTHAGSLVRARTKQHSLPYLRKKEHDSPREQLQAGRENTMPCESQGYQVNGGQRKANKKAAGSVTKTGGTDSDHAERVAYRGFGSTTDVLFLIVQDAFPCFDRVPSVLPPAVDEGLQHHYQGDGRQHLRPWFLFSQGNAHNPTVLHLLSRRPSHAFAAPAGATCRFPAHPASYRIDHDRAAPFEGGE